MARPALEELEHFRAGLKVRHGVLHKRKAEEQEAEAHHEFTYVAPASLLGNAQNEAKSHKRHCKYGDVRLEAEQGDDPGRKGRTDVGTHNDADSLGEGKKASVHEAHHHHGCGAGGLDDGSHAHTCHYTFYRIGSNRRKEFSEA